MISNQAECLCSNNLPKMISMMNILVDSWGIRVTGASDHIVYVRQMTCQRF